MIAPASQCTCDPKRAGTPCGGSESDEGECRCGHTAACCRARWTHLKRTIGRIDRQVAGRVVRRR
jgi:hypothetical protein